jgi:glycosyltransferase involved in cell wall biosynthesis
MSSGLPGVSFVLPVLNGRRWLGDVLTSIEAQRDGREFEIIVVDDGSRDGSRRLLKGAEAEGRLKLIDGPGRGSAAAINKGIREARYPIICQVDQDVILQPGWVTRLLAALEDPSVAAAQGHYVTAEDAGFWARVMGRDLEQRYAAIADDFVDHVCTGNSVYRASALHQVGLLDESLGYGSDNDLSYRLTQAGYRLAFCREAVSIHRWREGMRAYLRQQFGVGYGRLDLLAKHPQRVGGDDVSGAVMMAHGPLMLLAIVAMLTGMAAVPFTAFGFVILSFAAGLLLLLALERAWAGVVAWRALGDRAAMAFCVAHLLRDVVWACAIVQWTIRQLARTGSLPAHSMGRRAAGTLRPHWGDGIGAHRVLAIIPAFNEALNLGRVVSELHRRTPGIDVLIVNDGSTDDTPNILPTLGVSWLTLAQRVGVGGAVRAGLRFAAREGYEYVVRIDGDGQHRACDIAPVLTPVLTGRFDVIIGSRFRNRPGGRPTLLRLSQTALANCLTLLTGQRITDPTSGFWLFGPRAVQLLGRHHPTGYPEPELVLFLCRNGLRVGEVEIRMRPRLAGRTSLTPSRASLAIVRTLLALMIVPTRALVEGSRHD